MHLSTLLQFFGWMLAINLVFFAIGILKVTAFNGFTTSMTQKLFGKFGRQMTGELPKILMIYWIMIIMFNLVPYIALHILLFAN